LTELVAEERVFVVESTAALGASQRLLPLSILWVEDGFECIRVNNVIVKRYYSAYNVDLVLSNVYSKVDIVEIHMFRQ
jgi:hypothetical protein